MAEVINYRLDQFEGPLDLLLTLITKNKIDINDIPIFDLCTQYMEYINAEENRDMEIASEFLLMASELMLIKSRMLLPRQEDEEDPRASLVEAVLEYKKAKEAAVKMTLMYATYGLRMVKEQDEISVDKTYVADHSVELLARALRVAMSEIKISDEKVKERFDPIVSRPRVSVASAAATLIKRLRRHGSLYLDEYFSSSGDRSELISKFMAVLEMLRGGYVQVEESTFDNEDGVAAASSHITLTLGEDIDEDRLREEIETEYDTDDENKEDE